MKVDALEIEPLEKTSITRLNWSQALVSTTRHALADRTLHFHRPATSDGVPLDDFQLADFLKPGRMADMDAPALVSNWKLNPEYLKSEETFYDAQINFLREYRLAVHNEAYTGAVFATIYAELGWSVNKIVELLGTSRPTLNRWLMMYVGTPLAERDITAINNAASRHPWALMDVRTAIMRTQQTGLMWRKATFLPPRVIIPIIDALWRVSYRVRGDKSNPQDIACSQVLDLILDLLRRRGVAALNISRLIGVTHKAVLDRYDRTSTYLPGYDKAKFDEAILNMLYGFEPDDGTLFTEHGYEFEDILKKYSVKNHRAAGDDGASALFVVRTNERTDEAIPTRNVAVLCSPVYGTNVDRFFDLDDVPMYDVISTLEKAGDNQFQVDVFSDNSARVGFQLDRMRNRPLKELPTNTGAMGQLFDVDRHYYHGIWPRYAMHGGNVMAEAIFNQMTSAADRNDAPAGRVGFGKASYHWVPIEALYDQVFVSPIENSRAAIDALRKSASKNIDQTRPGTTRTGEVFYRDRTHDFERFFPEAHMEFITKKLLEFTDATAAHPSGSMLYDCLYRPAAVFDVLPLPKKHRKRPVEEVS